MTQPPPGSLGPDHEGIHGPLYMDSLLVQPRISFFQQMIQLSSTLDKYMANGQVAIICDEAKWVVGNSI